MALFRRIFSGSSTILQSQFSSIRLNSTLTSPKLFVSGPRTSALPNLMIGQLCSVTSGKSRFPEHLPLFSSAAVIFRECFDPIVAKSGRDLIPVMVYGRNISGQEFGGMYCIVLIVKSVVVSAALLRIFGQEVAELPMVATSRENQGKVFSARLDSFAVLICGFACWF
ncbi:hypothetical protein H5410_053537 [Solanum commersonii]|uniref:Increased DNA methylation 1 C-terminal domain-containing protein n=1 Tax=Solanum commersonii TaxID=4109 RepID=A0A9J5X6P4_SOLCO|nr:hypothetical protein H5410_053537 [Solanum commersonii]